MELEDILTDEELPTAKNVKKAAKAFGADFVLAFSDDSVL